MSLSAAPPSCKTAMMEEKGPSCSSCSRIVKKLFSFREIKKEPKGKRWVDSPFYLSYFYPLQPRSSHLSLQQWFSVCRKYFVRFLVYILILYPDTRFSKTRRTSKNLASFLFTFLSLRRSMMDRNKRRNSSETLLCNYILFMKGRFHVFYFTGVHAETVARQAKIKHDSRSFFTLKKPIRMRKESYRSQWLDF